MKLMWDKMFNIQYRADLLYRNGNDLEESMVKNIRHKDRGAELEIESDKHINETLSSTLWTFNVLSRLLIAMDVCM